MSDPATPIPAPSEESDRFALLDLDGGPTAAGELPPWAASAIKALATATSIDQIAAAIEAAKREPESIAKAAVRSAKDAAVARVRAARAALLVTLQLVWFQLWGFLGNAAGMPQHAAGAVALVQAKPALAAALAAPTALNSAPLRGTYSKLRGGEWGGRIAIPVGRDALVGDRVLITRKSGATQAHIITQVWWCDGGAALVSLGDAPPVTNNPPATVRQPIPVVAAAPVAVAPETSTPISFASIAAESSANASVASAGSMAGGQLAGVGFTSAAGYVTALANGVKAATAESYKSTLRSRYSYTDEQIAALTVTIIPEASLPVGAGITHGPASSDAGIAALRARTRLSRHGRQAVQELQTSVRTTLASAQLIAGLITDASLLQWSWVGGGETTRGRVVEALPETMKDLAPGSPSAVRYAGDAVDSMRSREYDTARLPSNDLPDGVKARWIVGRKLTGANVAAGAAYGEALLVVSLHDDDTLTFDGQASLAAAVRTRYDRSTAHETLRSDVLTAWLGSVLKRAFYAVKRGAAWYVPAAIQSEARQLCDAIAPLWGDHETITVTSATDVTRVLANGIRDEITKFSRDVEADILDAQERARVKAGKEGLDPEIAARRATLTVATAAKLIKQGATVAARLNGYSGPLPEATITELRGALTAAQKRLADFGGDDSIARAAMLEIG